MNDAQERTALYRLYDADEQLLYIGVTNNPRTRWSNHKATQPWWPEVATKTLEWFEDRCTALDAEATAIKAEKPTYNEMHADRPRLDPNEPGISVDERHRRLFGDELYERIRRDAQAWAEQAPPLDSEQRSRLRVLLRP